MTQLKPSLIAMDAINAFIVRCQSAHKTSPSNATRKAMAISLKAKAALPTNATSLLWGPHEYHDNNHPTTTIIAKRPSIATMCAQQMQTATFCWPAQESRVIRSMQLWQQLSPSAWPMQAAQALQQQWLRRQQAQQQEESPKCKDKGFKPWCLHGKHTNHSYSKCCANPCNQGQELQQQVQTTTKKHSRHDTCTTHHARNNCWTSSKLSCLAEPVTLLPATKEQAQAKTTKNTTFGKIPLTRGCLLFDALA